MTVIIRACHTTHNNIPAQQAQQQQQSIQDPLPQHARTASVYSHATLHADIYLSRRDQVLLAQLRSGKQ